MFCTKCGNQIKDGFKFCPKCGTPVYIEKGKAASDAKAQVDELKEDTSKKGPNSNKDDKAKKTSKSKAASSSPKTTASVSDNQNYIPNPLIAEELDIEGVMKKAEQGDKVAMLRQAFRYEMGIGVEKDVAKAEELYNNAGGKRALPQLERCHINSILPDPLYDNAFLSTDETDDDKDNVFRVIPFVKDVVLDYSKKVEQDKSQGQLSNEKSVFYRNEFIQRMKDIRKIHPELLFANMDETITEDDFNNLLNVVKESVSSRYSLKWIPSLFNFSDSIDGNSIDIPSIYDIKSNGVFVLNYHDEKDRKNLVNQFVFTLFLQIPIKKIRLHFVDLQKAFEYSDLLKLLSPIIYGEKPITSIDHLSDLLKHLEERRLEVIQKYGSFPEYCEQNLTIPFPYEVVILFDNLIVPQFEEAILDIMQDSFRFGILFIVFTKIDEMNNLNVRNGNIINPNKSELYTKTKLNFSYIWENGVVPYVVQSKDVKLYTLQVTSVDRNYEQQVIILLQVKLNLDIDEARSIFLGILSGCRTNIHVGLSLKEAEDLKKDLESLGANSIIIRFVCNDRLNEIGFDFKNRNVKGSGQYEVVLKFVKFVDSSNYDIERLKRFCRENEIESYTNKREYVHELLSDEGLLLRLFSQRNEAEDYIESTTPPNVTYSNYNRIRLVPYYLKKQKKDMIGIALFVPKDILRIYKNVKNDLHFYLTKIGFSSTIIKQIIDIVLNKTNVRVGNYEYFPTSKSETRCICISEGYIQNFQNIYNGIFFPDFLNNKYTMDFGFWGFNDNNSSDLNIAYEAINQCEQDICNIEKELDNFAIQEWGKGYAKEHLAFSDVIEDVAYFEVRKTKRYRIPIMQSIYSSSNGLIKPINIADNESFSQACINYINREAEAKEETKVVSLTYDDTNMSYENIKSELLIEVGKAEAKDADFRMDLVSHVHSFIIGQSGSGKSVFLHNIIGGAMLKYAPEDLQLYLLDFKLGGVEFNRYQGAKHVKALLVDNSDPQVTLEILRELRNSMTERGKRLRSAGVNNIGEYNKMHQQERMPHVLVVADECHEMFKADDSIPRQVRNEISDIVIKIAKEGRSQGVHLVFATQTLSGTEISSEIINNVSDFYLLKCAQTDSERLVPNSSTITSELSTGQIYYHHVDEQVKFQAYYTDKKTAEKLMAAIVEKAKDHKSNGEFYFNGAQMFYLDESVKEQIQNVKGKSPVAFLGKAIDISQKDLYIKLNEDFSENVLLLGLNDQEQVTRTTMNLFVSLMMSAKLKHKDVAFKVIDCLNNEEGEVHELIFDLENEGLCEIIERRQRSKFFKDLAQGVLDGTAEETILLILGQDRFRELKMDMELEENNSSKSSDNDDMMSISDDFFGGGDSSSSNIRTYRDALNVILDKGPDYGVHTLLQIEKASNLLFEDYITPKVVFQKFKHLVMLKSDETAGVTLHLNDDIRMEKLSSDWERLRAYYYAEESDSYTLFTPYMPSKSKDIINLLKTI